MKGLWDSRLANIKKYADTYGKLTDATAGQLAAAALRTCEIIKTAAKGEFSTGTGLVGTPGRVLANRLMFRIPPRGRFADFAYFFTPSQQRGPADHHPQEVLRPDEDRARRQVGGPVPTGREHARLHHWTPDPLRDPARPLNTPWRGTPQMAGPQFSPSSSFRSARPAPSPSSSPMPPAEACPLETG